MNPIGMHYGYWTQYWGSEPLQFVKRAKKCGFDILEVNAPKVTRMSDAERDVLKGAIAEAGLSLTYSIGMTADMDLVSEDTATRQKGIAFLQQVARTMKYMEGTVLAGINYSSWPRKLLPDEDKQILTDRAIEGVREAIKAAEDNDVIFCVEVVNRFEQFIMNTAAEGIAFAERVGSPNCKILLDTFHMNIEEESIGGAIVEAGPGWVISTWANPTVVRPDAAGCRGRRFSALCAKLTIRAHSSWSPSSFPVATSAVTSRFIATSPEATTLTEKQPARSNSSGRN